ARGRTTISIAHRLSTAARADRVLVVDAGRVVQDGTHAELLRDEDGVYGRLYEAWVAATAPDGAPDSGSVDVDTEWQRSVDSDDPAVH
nr:hypothetical protein [Acidimicrobiia bacterium]